MPLSEKNEEEVKEEMQAKFAEESNRVANDIDAYKLTIKQDGEVMFGLKVVERATNLM